MKNENIRKMAERFSYESLPSELKQFEGDLVLETLGSELAPLSSSLTLVTAVQPPQTMEESEVDDGEGDGGGGDR